MHSTFDGYYQAEIEYRSNRIRSDFAGRRRPARRVRLPFGRRSTPSSGATS